MLYHLKHPTLSPKTAAISVVILMYIIISLSTMAGKHNPFELSRPPNSRSWDTILSGCAGTENFWDLLDFLIVDVDADQNVDGCRLEARVLVEKLYEVQSIQNASLKLSSTLESIVRHEWLKDDMKLMQKMLRPKVVTVTNKWTLETTGINPLRSMRPRSSTAAGNQSELDYVLNLINASRTGCNFCNQDMTANEAELGDRVQAEWSHVYSASNLFRFYDHIGLFIPGGVHSYLDLDLATFRNLFLVVAQGWFRKMNAAHPEYTHPMMSWDTMPGSGASQVHPHVQGFMGKLMYLGKFRRLASSVDSYKQRHPRSDYFEDYFRAHVALGLADTYGTARLVVPLDSQKDHEMIVLGTELQDWTDLLFMVHRTYTEQLKVYCLSSAMAWPPLGPHSDGNGGLLIAILASRGDCRSTVNDVSALELFAINHLSSDPYSTIKAFRETKAQMGEL